jgi:hypothetical protein
LACPPSSCPAAACDRWAWATPWRRPRQGPALALMPLVRNGKACCHSGTLGTHTGGSVRRRGGRAERTHARAQETHTVWCCERTAAFLLFISFYYASTENGRAPAMPNFTQRRVHPHACAMAGSPGAGPSYSHATPSTRTAVHSPELVRMLNY